MESGRCAAASARFPARHAPDWRKAPSSPLFDHGLGIERSAALPDLEVQVRGGRAPAVAAEADDLSGLHCLAICHDDARKVSVHRLVLLGVVEENVEPILGVVADLVDGR